MEYNAKCSICGKPYYKCSACGELKAKPWKTVTDTMSHYKIYLILSNYTNKKITKAEAKDMLSDCGIKEYKKFNSNIVKAIDEILKEDAESLNDEKSVKKKKTKKSEEVSTENTDIEDVTK